MRLRVSGSGVGFCSGYASILKMIGCYHASEKDVRESEQAGAPDDSATHGDLEGGTEVSDPAHRYTRGAVRPMTSTEKRATWRAFDRTGDIFAKRLRREVIWMVHDHAKKCKNCRLLALDTERVIRLMEARLRALRLYKHSRCRTDRAAKGLIGEVELLCMGIVGIRVEPLGYVDGVYNKGRRNLVSPEST